MEEFKGFLPIITALIAVGVQWGASRAALNAFRKEIDELRRVVDSITGIDKRVALLEQTVKRLDEQLVPKLEREVEHVHDAAKAATASVRGEIAQLGSELRREIHATRTGDYTPIRS